MFLKKRTKYLNLSQNEWHTKAFIMPIAKPMKSEKTKIVITSLNEKQMPNIPSSLRSAPPNKPRANSGSKIKTGNKTESIVPKKSIP